MIVVIMWSNGVKIRVKFSIINGFSMWIIVGLKLKYFSDVYKYAGITAFFTN